MALHTAIFSNSHKPDANASLGDFASMAIWGELGRFDRFCSIGVSNGTEIIAAIIYHNYDPDNGVVEMSAGSTSPRWMNRRVLAEILDFPFDKLACQCIVARHDETAAHLRRMWGEVGAVEHIIPRVRGRGKPAEVVSVLTQEAWLSSKFKRH